MLEPATETPIDKREENQYLGHKVTIWGPKEIRWREGREVLIETNEPFEGMPKKFRKQHSDALSRIFFALYELEKSKRTMPLFREEAIQHLGIEKQVLKDLKSFGFLGDMMIACETQDKRKQGGRLIIFPTAQGRALKSIMDGIERNLREAQSAPPVDNPYKEKVLGILGDLNSSGE